MIVAIGEGLYELGLDDAGGQPREGFGGDSANTAVMAALMDVPARIVGRVGGDAVGRRLLAFWRTRGVDIEDVVVDPLRPTGIYVNRRGEDGVHRFDYHRSGSAGCAIEPADVALVPTEGVAFTHYTGIGLSVSATSAQACFSSCAALVRQVVAFRSRRTSDRASTRTSPFCARPLLRPTSSFFRRRTLHYCTATSTPPSRS